MPIKAPWLPLNLSSREEQVHSICMPSRRAHTSKTPMAGFCVNWYLLEMEKSKGGENHVNPCTRHRDKERHFTPMDGWLDREQQPVPVLGWKGRNGKEEQKEQN